MSQVAKQNQLFQPVQYNGQVYFTSQYFHQQYQANKAGDGKYAQLSTFNRLIRSIETYQDYVARGDIIEVTRKDLKNHGDTNFASLNSLLSASSGNPIMLINATAQVALTHHLDDEVSKSASVNANAAIAQQPDLFSLQTIQQQFDLPTSFSEALLLAGRLAAENEASKAKIEADRPKVEFAEAVRNLDGSCTIQEFAMSIDTGRNRLFRALRDHGVLQKNNLPHQRYKELGYFVVVEKIPFTDANGKTYPSFETRITGKGQIWLEKNMRKIKELIAAQKVTKKIK